MSFANIGNQKATIFVSAALITLVVGGYMGKKAFGQWAADFNAQQQQEAAQNQKLKDRPLSDKELLAAATANVPAEIDLNNTAPYGKAHALLQELEQRFPQSPYLAEAKSTDAEVSLTLHKINAIDELLANADARNQTAFDAAIHQYAKLLGKANIAELEHYMSSYSPIPKTFLGFDELHRLFFTSMEVGETYAVTAYYDRGGIQICGSVYHSGDCQGNYLWADIAIPITDPDRRGRVYDLRGQQGCFVIMKGGEHLPKILVSDALPGACDSGALKEHYLYQPTLNLAPTVSSPSDEPHRS